MNLEYITSQHNDKKLINVENISDIEKRIIDV